MADLTDTVTALDRLSFYCTPSEVCSYIVQITWVVGIERRIARFWLEVTA